MIWWAGKSSDDVNVIVESYPIRHTPERSLTATEVAGRNGDLLTLDGNFHNYEQDYEIYISAERVGLPRVARAVVLWLTAPQGYQRLEDSYEPDIFRLAYYSGGGEIESVLNRFGRGTISFQCKPQRFLKQGEFPITFSASGTLTNMTAFDALPIIDVYGTGAGSVTIGDTTVTISDIDDHLTLDCDLMDAYKGTVNKNAYISAAEFPSLKAGSNSVSFSGGVTSLKIVPRWWII